MFICCIKNYKVDNRKNNHDDCKPDIHCSDNCKTACNNTQIFYKRNNLLLKAFYFEHEVTGTPAVYPSTFNAIAQYIYVGDANSALYRLDIGTYIDPSTSTYHSVEQWGSDSTRTISQVVESPSGGQTTVQVTYEKPIFEPARLTSLGGNSSVADNMPTPPSPYNRITYKPAISVYHSENVKPTLMITFGTGSNDNFNITNNEHNFVANFYDYYDVNTHHYKLNSTSFTKAMPLVLLFNKPNGVLEKRNPTPQNGQKFAIYNSDPISGAAFDNDFQRQRMTGAPITYNFVSYFPTFIASSNESMAQCVTGNAAIWQIGDTQLNPRTHRNFNSTFNPANGVSVQNTSELGLFNGKSYYNMANGTKVYGLEITNQMFCRNDTNPSQSKISAPQLIAQTGGIATNKTGAGSSIDPVNIDLKSFSLNLNAFKPNPQKISWASVYE